MGCGQSKKAPFALDPMPEPALSPTSVPGLPRVTRLEDFHVRAGHFIQRLPAPITDRYRLLEPLGKGAEGEVRKAEHKLSGELRAIKVVEKRENWGSEWEAEVLSSLDHPNVIKIYEFASDETTAYLVEDLCTGGELLRYLQLSGRLYETEAAAVMRQILCAVAYCHANDLVHRDVKPENLLLSTPPAGPFVPTLKLIDFSSSCFLPQSLTCSQRVGSLVYMSPEMIKGEEYDRKTDIWSCGVILYLLLIGFPPFTGPRDCDIERKILRGNVIFPLSESVEVSKEAKKLVLKMLEKNVSMRWSAEECLASSWFTATDLESSYLAPTVQTSLTHLEGFSAKEQLKSVFYSFIAVNFSTKEGLRTMEETFRTLDKDGDGKLTRDELFQALVKAVPHYTAMAFTDEIMRKVDITKSGSIAYSQFLMAAADKTTLLSETVLKAAFDTLDLDGSGKISVSELKDLVKTQADMSDEVLEQLLRQADDNGDGEIEFEEFVRLMKTAHRRAH